MTSRFTWLGATLIALAGCSHTPKAPTGSHALFNGADLTGWTVMHGGQWRVEEGILTGSRGLNWSTDPALSGSWLRTDRAYGDFVLELDYAISANGNSGIFLRSGLDRNPAFNGMEMQILDDHGREPRNWTTGSLYGVAAPSRNMSKPAGQWNAVRIEARGPLIQIWLNGEEVIHATTDRALRGYLGFQNHDDRTVVRFRNIRLQEL